MQLRRLVSDLTVSWEGGEALLRRVPELMAPGSSRARGITGTRVHSPPPLSVHVLDLLMLVDRESRAWEQSFRRVLDLDDLPRALTREQTINAVQTLPDLADVLRISSMTEAVERDVSWWHSQCLTLMGYSPLEQRYRTTEETAKLVDKSTGALKMWAKRNGHEPVGYVRAGTTRLAIWDTREIVRAMRERVTV